MDERRRYKRLPIKLELAINELFRQDNEVISHVDQEIYVINVSKTGIGFECASDLPLSYYFDARIDFDEKNYFYCVVKIVRKENQEDTYLYGCEFVGLAEFLADKVDSYEATLENEEGN
jgi:c-di-GMP-binding flagellar brake protein YcgR